MDQEKLNELLKDRETMPVFDESIFESEKAVYAMGFTDSDIEEIVEYFRWLLNQRNRHLKLNELVSILRSRHDQLLKKRRAELLRELESLQLISI